MHVVGSGNSAACGAGAPDHCRVDAQSVAQAGRCMRSGCRQAWPDYRERSDRRVFK
jgi:hypothetical protein